jgi:drug/metabolite transporter (DMT)-like permease
MHDTKRGLIGGVIGTIIAGILITLIIWLFAFSEQQAQEDEAESRTSWLIIAGSCIVPAVMMYGWLLGRKLSRSRR